MLKINKTFSPLEEHKVKFLESLKFILYTRERYFRCCRIAIYNPSCYTFSSKTRRTNFENPRPLFTECYKYKRWWYTVYIRNSDLGILRVNDLVGVKKG